MNLLEKISTLESQINTLLELFQKQKIELQKLKSQNQKFKKSQSFPKLHTKVELQKYLSTVNSCILFFQSLQKQQNEPTSANQNTHMRENLPPQN